MTKRTHADRRTVLQTTGALLVGGCTVAGTASAATDTAGPASVVDVTAGHDESAGEHTLQLATDTVPSGWTSVRFHNPTDRTHFAYLAKLPQVAIDAANEAGVDVLDFYVEHVTRPFQYVMDTINENREPDPDDLSDRYSNAEEGVFFPPWFTKVLPSGGAGFTSAGMTAATTVDLDPGAYIVECYVKNPEGVFHSYDGMLALLTVTDEGAGSAAPAGTVDVSLSTEGIDAPDTVPAGQHTVAIRVQNQQTYSHLLGHDLHVIRLDGETTTDDVNGWMNWMAPDQLISDGEEPGTFVGGTQTILTPGLLDGSASERAFVHLDLTPGEYAWVSEVPTPADEGFLRPFTVTSSAGTASRVPPADVGSSGTWGPDLEAADDDLSERAASSALPDELKTAFDDLANVDGESG